MSARDYERLGVVPFARGLLRTGDLDPIYIALRRMHLPHAELARWLVSYWCFYHAGVACYHADLSDEDFWGSMLTAARNVEPSPVGGRWPRSPERRHFRGTQAVDAVAELLWKYDRAEDMLLYLMGGHWPWTAPLRRQPPRPFQEIAARVREHRGFGPWVSFKVGDMLERVVEVPVAFSLDDAMYEGSPTKGALLVYDRYITTTMKPDLQHERVSAAVAWLLGQLEAFRAPPMEDRPLGLQEAETICCKWSSHLSGHYPVGKDLREIAEGLAPWRAASPLASVMAESLPPLP